MAEPAATGSPGMPASTSTLPNPTPDVPSPVVSDVQLPASTGPATSLPQAPEQSEVQAQAQAQAQAPESQTVNGAALAAVATAVVAAAAQQSAVTSPAPRSETPQSQPHPLTPNPASTATAVNGQVVPAPPTTAAMPGLSFPPPPVRTKEQIRWRDPITVKYDNGQAQPGKLQSSNPSPQPKQLPFQQHVQPQSQIAQPQQSQPQHSTPPSQYTQSQPLPQSSLHAQAQQQQPPSHQQHLHPHSQLSQQQSQQPQPQYIQQQNHNSHPQPYPQQPPHVHPQQKQPLHPPPPPPQVATTALPPLHHQHPHPSQLPLQHPRPPATQTTISRPVIMDPPGSRKSTASPHPKGFPSPNLDHARVNSKFIDDCTRMTYAVQQSLPEAVRRTIRDHWEKCLFGSEFHQAFILNASIHHSQASITRRAVRDFGEKMVRESKNELMAHFRTEDFDEVADLIISKVSDSFLDKCLDKRLRTIEAKPLINALAKAERLGYEPGDIVEGDEHVVPQEAYPGATTAAATNGFAQSRPVQQPPQPQAQPYPAQHPLQCMSCFRTFTQIPAHDYHARYSVCHQVPPTNKGFEHSCSYCGQGFTRVEELQVHLADKVCTTPATKTSRGPGRPARSAPPTQPNPVAILPSMHQSPGPNGYTSYDQAQSTPAHHSTGPRASIGTPNSTASPNASDPYAHLTPETLNKMNQELQDAEIKYAPRFAEAEAIVDENERRAKIEGLRNSFGTKQSMIRKKYGVRLRERRTKAEIAAERERLGLKRAEREKAKAILAKQQLAANAQAAATSAGPGTGWTAANTPRAAQDIWDDHDAKRRRLDGTGGYETPSKSGVDDTPTRKTLSVSELGGGLSGTPATAETQDPTRPQSAQPLIQQQRQIGSVEVVTIDSQSQSPSNGVSNSDNGSRRSSLQGSSTSPLPGQPPADDMDLDSESSDDDQDIPSTLPANVRSSLVTQTHGLHA